MRRIGGEDTAITEKKRKVLKWCGHVMQMEESSCRNGKKVLIEYRSMQTYEKCFPSLIVCTE
jgi:hypothetical protein